MTAKKTTKTTETEPQTDETSPVDTTTDETAPAFYTIQSKASVVRVGSVYYPVIDGVATIPASEK